MMLVYVLFLLTVVPKSQAAKQNDLPNDDPLVSHEQEEAVKHFQEQWYRDSKYFAFYKMNPSEAAWFHSLGSYSVRKFEPPEYPDYPEYPDELKSKNGPNKGNSDQSSRTKRQVTPCNMIPGPLRVRKEYRQLNNMERASFLSALTALKTIIPPGMTMSGYDLLVTMHQASNSPAAHGGAGFLPWHREFLFRYRQAVVSFKFNIKDSIVTL